MLITFFIEIVCAAYVLFRYKMTLVSRIAVTILVSLAVFQFAEFNVCTIAWGMDSLSWARIGYVAITLLPSLGIHLILAITGRRNLALLVGAYGTATVFSFIFLFVGQGMLGEQCLGNYVIFKIAPWATWPYALYYYGWLIFGTIYAILLAGQKRYRKVQPALYALAVGYLAFIIPTTTVNVIDPTTIAGIPSIMCGFAVLLALILTARVLPLYYVAIKKK
jgi:hypothetical protein